MSATDGTTPAPGTAPTEPFAEPAELGGLVALLNDELGLELTVDQADLPLDALPGWGSFLLLRAVLALEAALGRPVAVAELLTAGTLRELLQVVRT